MGLTWLPGYVESGGERIYYELSQGDDPAATVVLGHGGLGSHPVWYQQVPVLAQRYRVVAWDTRGFGCSSLETGHISVDACVADLVAVLDAVGASEPVHLVGQSMGGWWLTGCAFAHRERIASLVYTNTTGGLFDGELDAAHTAAVDESAVLLAKGGPGHAQRLGFNPATGERFLETRPAQAFLYQELGSLRPTPNRIVREAVRARFDIDAFRALEIPTLVIGSSEDRMFPPGPLRGVAEKMGARYVEVDGAGHSTYFEMPDEWNAIVTSWVEEIGSRS